MPLATSEFPRPIGFAKLDLALNNQALAHEVGHILGAGHDPQQNAEDGAHPIADYGVGYVIPRTNKITIMAYPRGSNTVDNEYFSSRWGRDGEGSRNGDAAHDAVRLFNERARAQAAVGGEDLDCAGRRIAGGHPKGVNNCRNGAADNDCAYWAGLGNCRNRWSRWMEDHCARTCARNAHGDDRDCDYWLEKGFCLPGGRYAGWMAQNCAMACGTCNRN